MPSNPPGDCPIYRAFKNPLLDRMIARCRGDGGELIRKGTVAARRAIAALRRGTHPDPRPAGDVAPVPSSQSTHRWREADSNCRSRPQLTELTKPLRLV